MADGWWNWIGNLSGYFAFAPRLGFPANIDQITWCDNHVAYRHTRKFISNMLFMDHHVAQIAPREPKTLIDVRDNLIDTVKVFTWMPGERLSRLDADKYGPNRAGIDPNLAPGFAPNWTTNPAKPDVLDLTVRTQQNNWRKLPNVDQRQ